MAICSPGLTFHARYVSVLGRLQNGSLGQDSKRGLAEGGGQRQARREALAISLLLVFPPRPSPFPIKAVIRSLMEFARAIKIHSAFHSRMDIKCKYVDFLCGEKKKRNSEERSPPSHDM